MGLQPADIFRPLFAVRLHLPAVRPHCCPFTGATGVSGLPFSISSIAPRILATCSAWASKKACSSLTSRRRRQPDAARHVVSGALKTLNKPTATSLGKNRLSKPRRVIFSAAEMLKLASSPCGTTQPAMPHPKCDNWTACIVKQPLQSSLYRRAIHFAEILCFSCHVLERLALFGLLRALTSKARRLCQLAHPPYSRANEAVFGCALRVADGPAAQV